MSQQEKRHTFLILSVGVAVLILVLALAVFYWPKLQKAEEEKINENQIACQYSDEAEIFETARDSKDPKICLCIENYQSQQKCIQSAFDVGFYQEALQNLNISLCDKIVSDTIKQACQSVVAEGLEAQENNE